MRHDEYISPAGVQHACEQRQACLRRLNATRRTETFQAELGCGSCEACLEFSKSLSRRRMLQPTEGPVSRPPDTTASPGRQMLNTDTILSVSLCLHVSQLGPWDVLTGPTLAGTSLYRHAQPLHRPRALSHYPRTCPQRPHHHRSTPRRSGAASIALGPPCPPGRSVLPPRTTRGSTAFK